jgi:hypothetical protein
MPAPKSKKRRIDPPVKEKEEVQVQTATETTSNGTMAEEKAQHFETLQLHAG